MRVGAKAGPHGQSKRAEKAERKVHKEAEGAERKKGKEKAASAKPVAQQHLSAAHVQSTFQPQATRAVAGCSPAGAAQKPEATSQAGELTEAQKQAGWKQGAPLITQDPGSSDCGPAAGAMLVRAAGGGAGLSDDQLIQKMGGGAGQTGMTPFELGEKLAENGLRMEKVSDMSNKGDAKTMLDQGYKLVAQVDSSSLHAAAKGELPPAQKGNPHYVVIDGVDADGRLRVKDPAANTTYSVTQEQLQQAVDASQESHGGGGLMAVRPDPNALSAWRANAGANLMTLTAVVGGEEGGGARRRLTEMF